MTKVSISFVVALCFISFFVLAGLSVSGLAWRSLRRTRHDYQDFWLDGGLALIGGLVTVVLTLAIAAFSLFPYDMQYHQFTHVTGTVQEVQGRLLGDSNGGTSQYYALKLPTGTYRCDDTRCSLLKRGDNVSLWCIREWQYASTSGWGCRFESGGPS